MSITQSVIVNNRNTRVLFIVLILAGLQAFKDLPRAYAPGFVIRAAQLIDGVTASKAFAKLTPWIEEQSKSWVLGASYEPGGELESSGNANK